MAIQAMRIRFPYPLSRADRRAIQRLEEEFDEQVVQGRIGLEGERQVRTASGEIYNLDALQAPGDDDPQPPAPAMALVA